MTDMHREALRMPIIRPINVIDVWEHTPPDYYRRGDFDTALHYRDEQEKQA